MTAREMLVKNLDTLAYQIEKVYEGLPEGVFGAQLIPVAMSPAEMLEHLAECCVAFLASAEGNTHEWGSFSIEDKSPETMKATFWKLRREAADVAAQTDSDEILAHAYDYLVIHESYHVGQMALLRLTHDSGWDYFSIYRM